MITSDRFRQQYSAEAGQARFCRLDSLFQTIVRHLNLSPAQFFCLADCFNGVLWAEETTLLIGAFEIQIEDVAACRPEDFAQWRVDLPDLLGKIQPLTEVQRLALAYCVDLWFALPAEGKSSLEQALTKS
jgi:hypothetical protein